MASLPGLFPRTGSYIVGPPQAREPKGWDRAVLGGYVLPGHSRLSGHGGLVLEHEPKKCKGKDGSRPTFHGVTVKEFELVTEMWTDEQLQQYESILKEIGLKPGRTPDPLAFDHPAVRLLPFTSVTIIGQPVLTDGQGRTKVQALTLRPWLPPPANKEKKATKTPTRAIRNVRREDAEQRRAANPKPTQQPGVAGPTGEQQQLVETKRF